MKQAAMKKRSGLLLRAGTLAAMIWLSSCQMYSSGIGKSTHLVSDAPAALSWLTAHLPVYHDHAGLDCTSMPEPFNETFCPCGQAGRTGLFCPDCPPCRNCQPWSHGGGFGLHTISYNASAPHIVRPTPRAVSAGGVAAIEEHVARQLRAAAASAGYDALLDFSTGLWVSDLDPIIREFADAEQFNTLPIEWLDDVNGRMYYSLLVQVANKTFGSYMLLEYMSGVQTLLPTQRYRSPTPRFLFRRGEGPADIFPPLNDTYGPDNKPIPRPARLSHYSSDLSRDRLYYELVLGRPQDAPVLRASGTENVTSVVYNFSDMSNTPNYMQLWLTQRSVTNKTGDLTVAELEATVNSVHDEAITSDVCGWDQFMDFHYGVSTHNWRTLDEIIPVIERLGYKYHTGTTTWHPYSSGMLTLFAITPNGITIQLHNVARGNYTPSALPVQGHDGLCSVGPPSCPVAST